MDNDAGDLIERLKQFVTESARDQRLELERQWAIPLVERVRKGLALQALTFEHEFDDGVCQFRCAFNDSRFREGDMLVLHRGSPLEQPNLRCLLESDDEEILHISITDGDSSIFSLMPDGWLADEDALDLSQFFLKAIDQVADSSIGRENILPLLQDTRSPQIDFAGFQAAYDRAQAEGLNEGQADAAAMAYSVDLFHLIQGPPGTGKTRVLASLCRQLVLDGQRVLVTSLTHRAINNALNQLFSQDPALPMCKIGPRVRARDLLSENYENFAVSPLANLDSGYVIGATPFATQTSRLKGVEFDVIVFDEASQVTLPLALMGMTAGSKYIFIGDDRQLPPVSTGRKAELGRKSIFGYLSGRGAETMLEITYRMNAELTGWPSQTFYDSRLVSAPSARSRRLKLQPLYSDWDFALHPEEPFVFLDTGSRNATTSSRVEAGIVSDLVQALRQGGIPAYEIGVVTPFRAQARMIRKLLRQAGLERAEMDELVVDTVERMQGQEREVVLISWAASSQAFAQKLGEFLYQPERLNVAVTRPRTKLIMIGSSELTRVQAETEEVVGWIELFRNLLETAVTYQVPGGRTH